ncbi:hypothetical protein GQ54DRAFT_201675 [Martensiomyces pterosporus]|nr:hypothetical protein GQ54DRAFT_201675 [Martensiomyces pterosporus]
MGRCSASTPLHASRLRSRKSPRRTAVGGFAEVISAWGPVVFAVLSCTAKHLRCLAVRSKEEKYMSDIAHPLPVGREAAAAALARESQCGPTSPTGGRLAIATTFLAHGRKAH